MPEVMTIGEPMVNLIADSTETYLEARQLPRQMAGAEFNVAIGVSRQGHSIGYVTQLGDDWQGDLIVDYMNATGIDTSAIRRVSGAATGFQLKVRSSDGEPKVIYFRAGSAAPPLRRPRRTSWTMWTSPACASCMSPAFSPHSPTRRMKPSTPWWTPPRHTA